MKRRSIWTRIASIALSSALCLTMVSTVKLEARADSEVLTGKTSLEITSMMDKGFNIGNTFDATGGSAGDISGHETSWGNPVVNRELIHGIKEAGYSTVRIPCTWAKHMAKDDNYTIEPEFLARIKEVIDWCYEEDLFVILNVHHEGWLNKETYTTDYENIGVRLGALWSQVAEYFKDYDQHLIFEGMNEPRAQGTAYEWNGNEDGYRATNYLNQVFVNAVRGNGEGYNSERILGIPAYAASNSASSLRSIEIPQFNGEPVNNIAISVHCYSPYEFCLTDKQKTFNSANASDTSDIKRTINDINTLFVANGIAAYIGECGATNSGDNLDARIEYFNFLGNITRENNIPAIVWDNGAGGTSGGECHRYFNRKTGELVNPQLTEAFINGYDPTAVAEDTVIDFEPKMQGGKATITAPGDMGFLPKQVTNQAKVNHTEDATVGYSLKIAKAVENQTAYYDISRFGGKYIKVTLYVLAEGGEVSLGYKTDSETELAKVSPSSDWQEVTLAVKVEEKTETSLYFKGGNAEENFFIDDISIEIVDEKAFGSITSGLSSDEVTASEETAQEAVADVMGEDDDASFAQPQEENKSNIGAFVAIIAAVVLIAGIVVRNKKKKK